jgi:hypothetical protein
LPCVGEGKAQAAGGKTRRKKKALEVAASSGEVWFAENAVRKKAQGGGEGLDGRKAVRKAFKCDILLLSDIEGQSVSLHNVGLEVCRYHPQRES